jgi:hypothetical protein
MISAELGEPSVIVNVHPDSAGSWDARAWCGRSTTVETKSAPFGALIARFRVLPDRAESRFDGTFLLRDWPFPGED